MIRIIRNYHSETNDLNAFAFGFKNLLKINVKDKKDIHKLSTLRTHREESLQVQETTTFERNMFLIPKYDQILRFT